MHAVYAGTLSGSLMLMFLLQKVTQGLIINMNAKKSNRPGSCMQHIGISRFLLAYCK